MMTLTRLFWTLCLLGLAASLAACHEAAATDAPEGQKPASSQTAGGKADIYGKDDRHDYYESADPVLKQVADATAVLVRPFRVKDGDSPETRRLRDDTFAEEKNLCASEPYREQRAPGFCTGFLVAPDVLATAAHCVDDLADCKNTRFVFDFRYESADDDPTLVDADDIYSCASLLARQHDDQIGRDIGTDWALVRLDRTVDDRAPVSLRDRGVLGEGDWVGLVGHPSGLPLKIAPGGRVFDVSSDVYFSSDLDSYGGNSGSPVVNMITGAVEGIHVRGTRDFVDTEAGCSVSRVCEEVGDDGCGGNSAVRVGQFRPWIAPPAGSAGWVRAEGHGFEAHGDEWTSTVEVDASGSVDFVTVDVDTDVALPGDARVILEVDDRVVDLTRMYHGRVDLGGESAVASLYGAEVAGRWTLRLKGVNPESIHAWRLGVHRN
ncbi:trypsin-like serine peptidase [Persicimonas caeni]|nr:serine protease [Persicimonas caeni]